MEPRKFNWPLLALATGAFGIGVTEFGPMGMLPIIAKGVDVSIPSAGLLISAYAIGVMVGAPVMTLLFSRLGKRSALIALMAIFTLGNLMSAMAPGYWTLLLARVVTSLNHGAFFGLGALVAASVVPKEKQAAAVAAMFMGLTIANIGGVPVATWIGQHIGWRAAFACTAGLGLVTIAALWVALPKGMAGNRPDVRSELRVLMRADVLIAMSTTVLGASAMFTIYTYITPLLKTLIDAPDHFVMIGLMTIGVGFTIGNWFGGRLASWSLDGATALFLGALAVISVAMPLVMFNQFSSTITLLVWGAAAFAIVPPVQMRVMMTAHDAPGLASSLNIGAFNLGNAIGAALGGAVLQAGFGYGVVPVAGGLTAAAALILVWMGRQRLGSAS